MQNSKLILKKYFVDKLSIETNKNFVSNGDKITVNSQFFFNVSKQSTYEAVCTLQILIDDKEVPFKIDAKIGGLFYLKDYEKDEFNKSIMTKNTLSILFPFLRSLVSNLTLSANYPAYILPIMDLSNISNN